MFLVVLQALLVLYIVLVLNVCQEEFHKYVISSRNMSVKDVLSQDGGFVHYLGKIFIHLNI